MVLLHPWHAQSSCFLYLKQLFLMLAGPQPAHFTSMLTPNNTIQTQNSIKH